jgi:glyoxylase I family protein
MTTEVLGIDHVYIAVSALDVSERFYDSALCSVLGFRKSRFVLNGTQHVNYYNRQFGFVLRAARPGTGVHDPEAPGLHHFCLRVDGTRDVDAVARELSEHGIVGEAPRYYPEYAPDYYAVFFRDPDGVRLEVTNFRAERRERMERWD